MGKHPDNFKLAVKKDRGDVDAITASTITSRAYCDAVKRAYSALEICKSLENDFMNFTTKYMDQWKNFSKGFIKENAVFALFLGLCPTLGVTTSAINGLGMGLATTFVLVMSNLVVSLVKNLIPDKVRIPAFIVIIATFVTVVELVMKGYVPALFDALGLFIPLIVVNCLVLGRAEAFASKNTVWSSLVDGWEWDSDSPWH